MSGTLGKRWAKLPAFCERYGISEQQSRILGGYRYLESLDELPRQVLINSLNWETPKSRAAAHIGMKSVRSAQPSIPLKRVNVARPERIEHMLQLAARRAA